MINDYWNDGYCVRDIAILSGIHPTTILKHLGMTSKECQKRGPVILRNKNSTKTFMDYNIGRPNPVSCYDINTGEFVMSFPSINQASEYMNSNSHGTISRAIAGKIKSAFGYYWKEGNDQTKLSDEFMAERKQKRKAIQRPVVCIETNKMYSSASYAQELTGIQRATISLVCRGYDKTAGGFHWRYATENDKSNLILLSKERCMKEKYYNSQRVLCVETGIIYNSIHQASKETGSHQSAISQCCRGTRQTTNNLHWKYADK